jgi:DNA topoisomerase-2
VLVCQAAEFELMKLSNKARFIMAVVAGTLIISNRRKADIETELDAQGYDRIAPVKKVRQS